MVYMMQHSTNTLNCIPIFFFDCRISFIPDDGLHISQNVEQNNVFDYCGCFICHTNNLVQPVGKFLKHLRPFTHFCNSLLKINQFVKKQLDRTWLCARDFAV